MFCLPSLVDFNEADVFAPRSQFNHFCIVRTVGRENRFHHPSFHKIHRRTTCVHINGYPFLWAIKEILNRAPLLKVIEVLPKMMRMVRPSYHALCWQKGVLIVPRYHKICHRWKLGENRSSQYKENRLFFLFLEGEQKTLFDELLDLGIKSALIARDYYCLSGGEFTSQYEVAIKYGYRQGRYVSVLLNSLRYYLDPDFITSRQAVVTAESLKKEVVRLRRKRNQALAVEREYSRKLQEAGLESLPKGLPRRKIDQYLLVQYAQKQGVLDMFVTRFQKAGGIMRFHFGIETGKYQTLQSTAERFACSRQNIDQALARGFHYFAKRITKEG